MDHLDASEEGQHGTISYYGQSIGSLAGAWSSSSWRLVFFISKEQAVSVFLSASYSTLSSIRMPPQPQPGEGSTEAWKHDREAAGQYFKRAYTLQSNLDIPVFPDEGIGWHDLGSTHELEMPSIKIHPSASEYLFWRGFALLRTRDHPASKKTEERRADLHGQGQG
ncbi:hypothetical protein BDR06DRAFT_1012517 [Suillus hirtellus]|nr:hypothetical protein BDR06DRAFT_1012517 [Suillus hirtellus]